MPSVTVNAEFLGGLDVIFGGVRKSKCKVTKDSDDPIILKDLMTHIANNLIVHKKDYDVFIEDDTIRPGILVLVNDTDWELEGEENYELEDGDLITFTSTLHGG
ncbi:hypothetical protein CANARDRAFT_27225 [[Candida] arabinofermentans NRRL YB-2248]|uniref:Ubiquitin-related modifier 1 n=1 Tax=[Candida] arabinofermentans NRRL YB-2248 TaxID=983967 RepID=A0A1E4T505_9ASCO|nr:hypothetical protein CANARDRAFT_27225 [[Candida] arabinofermentans NRRL YB-2248]